ncbi:MAG: peptidase [Bacteroidia bacterium]
MLRHELKSRIDEDICVLVRTDSARWNYLCDCGLAADLSVRECLETLAVFISHTHIDHFIDFDRLIRHQVGTGRMVTVCGPKNIQQHVSSKLRGYNWNLVHIDEEENASYLIHELVEEQKMVRWKLEAPEWLPVFLDETTSSDCIFQGESFDVRATLLDHGTPCVAYLFEEHARSTFLMKQSPYLAGPWIKELQTAWKQELPETWIDVNGEKMQAQDLFYLLEKQRVQTLGYIMDHSATPENHAKIEALFSNADTVYMECYYPESELEFAIRNNHSTAKRSGEICRRIGIKNPIPVHFSRRYHSDEILLQEIRAEFKLAWETAFEKSPTNQTKT